jgi:esterase
MSAPTPSISRRLKPNPKKANINRGVALNHPQRVAALAVADMAPVTYPGRFRTILETLASLELTTIGSRRDADARLEKSISDPAVRAYLLQNLVKEDEGWRWRINLAALSESIDSLMSFPAVEGLQFPGSALFIYGTESDYVTGERLPAIKTLFPLARLRAVPNAGHWVYAEQPDAVVSALRGFL